MGCSSAPEPKVTVLPASQLFVTRVGDSTPKEGDCEPQTLDKIPDAGYRPLGTFKLSGTVPSRVDVATLVNQKACQMGADAIYFQQMQQTGPPGHVDYAVVADTYTRIEGEAASEPAEQPADADNEPGQGENQQSQPQGAGTSQMQPDDNGTPQPSLVAPVIPMQTGDTDGIPATVAR